MRRRAWRQGPGPHAGTDGLSLPRVVGAQGRCPVALGPAGVVPTWPVCPDGELGKPRFPSWVSLAGHHCLHATCPEGLISLCFNPAVRSPCSLVGVTLAVLGPQPWPCPRAAPWTMQRGQENQGSLVLCMCGRLRTSELFSLAAPISPSPHLIDAGADL